MDQQSGAASAPEVKEQKKKGRILICCETPASSVDPRLLEALSSVAPTVEVITYE